MRLKSWIACLSAAALISLQAAVPAAAKDRAGGGELKIAAKPAADEKKAEAPKGAVKKAKDRCKDGEPSKVGKYEISKGKNLPASISKPLADGKGDAEKGLGWMAHRRLGNCLACHEITKVLDLAKTKSQIEITDLNGKTSKMPLGTHGHIGPSLDGVADRYTEGELRMLVVNAKKIFPDTIMPAFHRNDGFTNVHPDCDGLAILSAAQVEDVVAFLKTLKE